MAIDFKHIRTSIIPFGNNKSNGAYRFSLCIDFNPDITSEENQLEDFIRGYGSKYFNDIKNNFKVSINGGDVLKYGFCFENHFLNNVPSIWNEFLK